MPVKKKTAEEAVEEVVETVEAPQEVEVEVKADSKPAKEQLVRVKPNTSYKTKIGGTYYYFEKGVCQNVPQNVKNIMAEGGMLMVL